MKVVALGLTLVATAAASDAPGILLGNWCGEGDDAIWIGRDEVVLGEHAYCRWDTQLKDGLSHVGVLKCRTTQELYADSVEHPLPVSLMMDARGRMTINYPDGGAPEEWRRCAG